MASGLCAAVVVLALCALLSPCVSGDNDCKAYKHAFTGVYQAPKTCFLGTFCCGTCNNRYCCSSGVLRLSEDEQEDCYAPPSNMTISLHLIIGISIAVICVLVLICCCVCPCCCLYKVLCKRRPAINTTTHTTVVTSVPQQYPRQQITTPPGYQYPSYQATPMQPGYGTQPVPQSYGVQPMPTVPYQEQPYTPGPPPTYQEATGPAYPPNPMPYSQAAFTPGQTPYPPQPPVQLQPTAMPSQNDYLTQPAYNPDYVGPQPRTG